MKNWTAQFPKYSVELLCTVIFAYQKLFSPDHGLIGGFVGTGHCKFFPSCSAYAIGAIRQYGLLRGTVHRSKEFYDAIHGVPADTIQFYKHKQHEQ